MALSTLSFNAFATDPFATLPPIFPLLNVPDEYCPLTRCLTFGNLDSFHLPDGVTLYCLKQSAGVALWWTLSSIASDINTAGISPIRFDHAYPAAIRSYVPDMLFEQIGMPRPEVLKAIEIDSFNPLYHLTTIPNIVGLWTQLQQVGLAGLAWIKEAKAHCQRSGPTCGWDWNFHQTQLADLPANLYRNHPVIDSHNALSLHLTYDPSQNGLLSPTPPNSELSSTCSDYSFSDSAPMINAPNPCSDLVLHPILSRYVAAHPTYDVFSQEPLVDNGYVDAEMKDGTEDDDTKSVGSDQSFTSSFSDCHSCHSLPTLPINGSMDFYQARFPIMVEDVLMDVDDEASPTATQLASTIFPVLRTDIVNA